MSDQGQMFIARFNAGDEQAFREVFARYYKPLCGYIYDIIRDSEAADDVVQDIFMALWNRHTDFNAIEKIASFLLRNLVDNVPQPYTYDVFRSVLCQLSTDEPEWSLEQCAVVFKTAYLYENGLLPESRDPRVNEFIENIVASGIENSPLPDCSHDYWRKLHLWLNRIIDYHKLRR